MYLSNLIRNLAVQLVLLTNLIENFGNNPSRILDVPINQHALHYLRRLDMATLNHLVARSRPPQICTDQSINCYPPTPSSGFPLPPLQCTEIFAAPNCPTSCKEETPCCYQSYTPYDRYCDVDNCNEKSKDECDRVECDEKPCEKPCDEKLCKSNYCPDTFDSYHHDKCDMCCTDNDSCTDNDDCCHENSKCRNKYIEDECWCEQEVCRRPFRKRPCERVILEENPCTCRKSQPKEWYPISRNYPHYPHVYGYSNYSPYQRYPYHPYYP